MFNETIPAFNHADFGEGYSMMAHHGPFSWVISILIILAIVMVISRLWRGGPHHSGRHGGRSDALDILEQRFANGKIDENEFREKRTVLKSRN